MSYLSEEFLSDLCEEGITGTCCHYRCSLPAVIWIETDSDGHRFKDVWCRAHADALLADLRANADAARALDEAAKVRLGFDPEAFCEWCGYRNDRARCRCYGDPLRPVSWEVPAFDGLHRDERREILAGWEAPRIPSLSD
jgi:hypothetical protein